MDYQLAHRSGRGAGHIKEALMAEIIGVRFKNVGKIYYFDPAGLKIERGSHVIVETARGVECGTVAAVSYTHLAQGSWHCARRAGFYPGD